MTNIEWTDETFSPMTGCSRTPSPACDHCWASSFMHRGLRPEHRGLTVLRTRKVDGVECTEPDWNGVVRFLPERLATPFRWRAPRKCFPNSISDTFHPKFTFEQIAAFHGMMFATAHVTYQCLTKRPDRALEFQAWLARKSPSMGKKEYASICLELLFDALSEADADPKILERVETVWARNKFDPWPASNVWFGVSVANQEDADRWLPLALEFEAALHWCSYEPALGPVDFRPWLPKMGRLEYVGPEMRALGYAEGPAKISDGPKLGWAVVGGESGPHARPFNIGWAEFAIEQFKAAHTPIFVKQVGRRPYALIEGGHHAFMFPGAKAAKIEDDRIWFELHDKHGGDWGEWPGELCVRQFPGEP